MVPPYPNYTWVAPSLESCVWPAGNTAAYGSNNCRHSKSTSCQNAHPKMWLWLWNNKDEFRKIFKYIPISTDTRITPEICEILTNKDIKAAKPEYYISPTGSIAFPKLQSWKKNVDTFYLIYEKINPRFPNSMLIQVMLSKASARSSNIDRWGREGLW